MIDDMIKPEYKGRTIDGRTGHDRAGAGRTDNDKGPYAMHDVWRYDGWHRDNYGSPDAQHGF
jgi:hypothetical protein